MTGLDRQALLAILPLLVLSGGAVIIMLQLSVRRSVNSAYWLALLTLLAGAGSTGLVGSGDSVPVTPLLVADPYAGFFSSLFCLAAAVTVVLARDYLRDRDGHNEEFFLLVVLSTLGAVVLAHASHLASLLLGMELLGVSLYALVAYPERGQLPLEAAIKYLVLSAAASAIFLFGFALLYAVTGTLAFDAIGQGIRAVTPDQPVLLSAAGVLVLAGLAFKLSAVPFHMWTPDIYEGAPAPVTGFIAAVSKAAIFAAVIRWWFASEFYSFPTIVATVGVLAGVSMLIGNWLALLQENLKRLLAYSSIAHMGYLLIVLVAAGSAGGSTLAIEAACYYLVAYTITVLAAFSLVGALSSPDEDNDRDQVADLHGLFWSQPLLALMLTVALLSLAGIPLTAGFIAKFYLFATGVDAGLWVLLWLMVIGSGIGIFYYLRLVYAMTRPAEGEPRKVPVTAASCLVFCALVAAMLLLGILPESLTAYLRTIL